MNKNFVPPETSPRLTLVRYTGTAQVLHWTTALLMFAVLPIAWVMTSLAHDNPNRDMLYLMHKSIGVTILVLTAIRIVWRASHRAPILPATMRGWEVAIAKLSHWLLYAILLIMPISGYVTSAAGGHPVSFFYLFTLPSLPLDKGLAKFAEEVHLLTQWAVYVLIALHILATSWHIVVRRDGILDRMLPRQRNAA